MSNPHLHNEKDFLTPVDKEFENNIRPSQIADFSGQEQIIENLRIFIKAAKMRGKHWTMCFSTVLPGWEKLLCPGSWRTNSA